MLISLFECNNLCYRKMGLYIYNCDISLCAIFIEKINNLYCKSISQIPADNCLCYQFLWYQNFIILTHWIVFIISGKITSQSNNVVANKGGITLLSNIILEY